MITVMIDQEKETEEEIQKEAEEDLIIIPHEQQNKS